MSLWYWPKSSWKEVMRRRLPSRREVAFALEMYRTEEGGGEMRQECEVTLDHLFNSGWGMILSVINREDLYDTETLREWSERGAALKLVLIEIPLEEEKR